MRKNQYYENLCERVINLSESDTWETAVQEWEILNCEVDNSQVQSCVCGKDRLKYLFTIGNTKNGEILYPIGSTCIEKFGREDLDCEISAYKDMFELICAIENKKYIKLTSEYFSRNLLEYLYRKGAFKPTIHNHFDGKEDYNFMLDMFNKRNKDEIDTARDKKINAVILNSIVPFMKSKIKSTRETCPQCGADMIIRISKKGRNPGARFWGCTNFPNCQHTKNMK